MELDESIFGIREFQLTDTLLFDAYFKEAADSNMRTIKIKTDPHSGFNSLVNSNVATFCQQQNCPTSSFAGGQSPTKATAIRVGTRCFTCFDFTLTIEDPFVWPPDPDFTGGGGGTGGGGSTPPNTGNCTGVSTCRPGTLIEVGRIPCGGCGPGPIVVVPPDVPTFNPYTADTVIIDPTLRTNFPCVARIIDSLTSYANMNALAQVALKEVFGINQRIHLTFIADNSLPIDEDGHTESGNLYNGDSIYATTVHLNEWMLTHSTQEYIASTIIHESIHAFIQYKYQQYLYGNIDSTQFKTLFPLYWPPRSLGQANGQYIYSMGNSPQHTAMAANMINIMKQALVSLYPNSHINELTRDSVYKAIVWGGLENTPSFSVRSDTLFIYAMTNMARDTSLHIPFNISLNGTTIGNHYQYDSHNLSLLKSCQ